ncbi:MAG: putative L-gulonolactone oxidase-like [Harvfovirus sp.]|uniref:Putative L-gulonolactone oxidase-like n=1 Tax=Harvfovirus sp. TaxID=2487768 RepID=A0A3G5A3F2_9VIRU|nr:MAG: putative L-gulonolactone oxidase-like [Harvfovirus sp.]
MSYENFNDLYEIRPKHYLKVGNLVEFIEGVKNAAKVRVIGGNHPFNDIALCDDTIIDTVRLREIVVDRGNLQVTVEAGVTLSRLLKYLSREQLTIDVMTATNDISVVGGISTGSHGSYAERGSMSSLVIGAKIILADGTYRDANERELEGIRCSLGCLAAIYSVSLSAVKMFSIEERYLEAKWSELNIDKILKEYPLTDISVDQHSEEITAANVVFSGLYIPYKFSLPTVINCTTLSEIGSDKISAISNSLSCSP